MIKKNLKKIISVSSFLTLFLTQTAFAASGSSVTYSDHGTSTTNTSYGGQTLTTTSTFYYTSNEIGVVLESSSTSTGTGPTSISASAYKKHVICSPIKTVGNHLVNGWAEYYKHTSYSYY